MINYVSDGENKEYITIRFMDLITLFDSAEKNVQKLLINLYKPTFQYCTENGEAVVDVDVTISKESELGKYILNNKSIFIDDDDKITYDKVINAFNVSVYKEDIKMSNRLMHLFKGRVEGMRAERSYIDSNVLDYITENGNFKSFLAKEDGVVENKKQLVYDDKENSVSMEFLSSIKQKKKD